MSQKSIESGAYQIEKFRDDLVSLQHGERFFMGKFWLTTFQAGLLRPTSFLPTVHAAAKQEEEEAPKKPPPMPYTELPLCESPHLEYKDYLEEQEKKKCKSGKRKILFERIYPWVKSTRESCGKSFCELPKKLCETKGEFCAAVQTRKNDFVQYMRSPENLALRRGVVVAGGLTGFYLGSGRYLVARRIVGAGLGVLATGALCFPKETDIYFREFSFQTAKFILQVYNGFCNQSAGMKGRLPCRSELPEPLVVQRKPNDCPCKEK